MLKCTIHLLCNFENHAQRQEWIHSSERSAVHTTCKHTHIDAIKWTEPRIKFFLHDLLHGAVALPKNISKVAHSKRLHFEGHTHAHIQLTAYNTQTPRSKRRIAIGTMTCQSDGGRCSGVPWDGKWTIRRICQQLTKYYVR